MFFELAIDDLTEAADLLRPIFDRLSGCGAAALCRVVSDPHSLDKGWVGFDFESAFGCPDKLINEVAIQALGSYHGGKLLILGFGRPLWDRSGHPRNDDRESPNSTDLAADAGLSLCRQRIAARRVPWWLDGSPTMRRRAS